MPIFKANKKSITTAAQIIKAGGIAAFPTETVYGLGANAFDARAVRKIFALKGRPSDNPLIVHIADLEDLEKISNLQFPISNYGNPHLNSPPASRGSKEEEVITRSVIDKLTAAFWPGPLTLVLPKNKNIPNEVSAGLETVAVRMPSHRVARALIRAAGVPIAAPSANKSGCPSPTTAGHVADDFGEKLFILDGGPTEFGLESTVLDLTVDPPLILRLGAITLETIREILPEVVTRGDDGNPSTSSGNIIFKSPGMKYRHYAPRAPLFLARGENGAMVSDIQYFILSHNNLRVGVLTINEHADCFGEAAEVTSLGSRRNPEQLARNLFDSLRKFDKLNVDVIISETFSKVGIEAAIMERLEKAARSKS